MSSCCQLQYRFTSKQCRDNNRNRNLICVDNLDRKQMAKVNGERLLTYELQLTLAIHVQCNNVQCTRCVYKQHDLYNLTLPHTGNQSVTLLALQPVPTTSHYLVDNGDRTLFDLEKNWCRFERRQKLSSADLSGHWRCQSDNSWGCVWHYGLQVLRDVCTRRSARRRTRGLQR